MQINEMFFNAELEDILTELKAQLNANGADYFSKGFKESGDSLQMQCPYHSEGRERRPSAGMRKSDGRFHCFACQQIADLPEVISHCFGKQDLLGRFGWTWLLKNFATVQAEERKDVRLDFARNSRNIGASGNTSDIGRHIQYIGEQELDSYRYTHPYMYKRGLTDEIIELFDIGYDKKTQSITFPVRDIDGRCVFVARRSIKTKFYNYPEGVEKPLYGLYELHRQQNSYDEVIICEGMFDALSCWVWGKAAVALNGLGNKLQFKQLNDLRARKFILATDNDEAGRKARERLRQNIKRKIITEYIFPENRKDINSLTQKEFDSLEEIF